MDVEAEVRALPPLVPMRDVAHALGRHYDTVLAQVRQGTLPVPVVQVGRRRFARKTDLLVFLGLAPVEVQVQRTPAAVSEDVLAQRGRPS